MIHLPFGPGGPWWGESTAGVRMSPMQIGEWHPWSCTPTCVHVGERGLLQVQGQVMGSRQWGAAGSAQQQHAGASAVLAVCCGPGPRLHMAPGGGRAQSAPSQPLDAHTGEVGLGQPCTHNAAGRAVLIDQPLQRQALDQFTRQQGSCYILLVGQAGAQGKIVSPGAISLHAPHRCWGSHSPPQPQTLQPYSKRGFPETSG